MCIYDADPSTVWDHEIRKARKQHRCDECGGPVPVGTKHHYARSMFDGSWGTFRWHTECSELWDFVHEVVCGGEGQIVVGMLREELQESGIGYWDEEKDERVNPLEGVLDEIRTTYEAMVTQ